MKAITVEPKVPGTTPRPFPQRDKFASKALSPAINDPTTAVLALDQIHRLLRTVAVRRLDTGRVNDGDGQLRLAYRTPDWEDFVSLAVTVVPPQRVALLRVELDLLSRGVDHDFRDPGNPREVLHIRGF